MTGMGIHRGNKEAMTAQCALSFPPAPRPLARPYRVAPGHGGEKNFLVLNLWLLAATFGAERGGIGGPQAALGYLQSSLWAR